MSAVVYSPVSQKRGFTIEEMKSQRIGCSQSGKTEKLSRNSRLKKARRLKKSKTKRKQSTKLDFLDSKNDEIVDNNRFLD